MAVTDPLTNAELAERLENIRMKLRHDPVEPRDGDFVAEAARRLTATCATCRWGQVRTVEDHGCVARECRHPTLRYWFDDEGLGAQTTFPQPFGCALHTPRPDEVPRG